MIKLNGFLIKPTKWIKGTKPKRIKWYAGMQYDGDIARVKTVLSDLGKYYPGAQKYEIAGFLWWQGDRDSRSAPSCTAPAPPASDLDTLRP